MKKRHDPLTILLTVSLAVFLFLAGYTLYAFLTDNDEQVGPQSSEQTGTLGEEVPVPAGN